MYSTIFTGICEAPEDVYAIFTGICEAPEDVYAIFTGICEAPEDVLQDEAVRPLSAVKVVKWSP